MNYLLDTNTCSDVLRRRFGVAERLQRVSPAGLHISAITIAEARAGALKTSRSADLLLVWDYFLQPFVDRILPFDKDAAGHYGTVRAFLEARGEMIGDRDCMIASIARQHEMTLVSSNVREFRRVPQLQVEDWRDPLAGASGQPST